MASSILESSEEKTNGWKLIRLIVDGGTEALREVFLSIHPGKLQHVLATHYSTLYPLYNSKKIITQPQWDKMYPHPHTIPNIQEFDITLLVILLRNICGLSAPSTGWNTMPGLADKSREANIVRIRLFRNNFFGHVPGTAVGRLEFEDRWEEVSSALVDLGLSQAEIDRLEAEECGEEEVNRVREKWNKSERESVLKLDRIELKLDQLEKTLEEVRTLSHESSQQVKSSSDNIIKKSLDCCDFESDIQLLLNRYTKGTRKWVFEQVLTWLNNKSSPNRAFIIAGQAGMGKSTIAAVICKLFPEHFAACHFFQYSNTRYNNSKLLLQSLAVQLCNVFPKYMEELTKKLSDCENKILSDYNIEGLFSLLFKEPFTKCICDQSTPFLIVIDALDECRQEDRYELVDLISTHFHKLPSYIRFFITTRPEKDIVRKFPTLNPILLKPNEEKNLNDVRVFFENKIETETEIENLMKKSEGLMLYASFIAKSFQDNFSISNPESLPKGIEDIYESYFKRLEEDLHIAVEKFSSFLSVVAVAKQPLPMPFIEKILCPEKHSLSERRLLLQVISCVSSLFVVKDECISIFHKSIRDWLVKPGHSFTIIETDGHKTLADICVNQLQMLKQCEVRFTFDPATKYALQYGIPHILEAKIKDEHSLARLIDEVIDLEVIHSSVCTDVDTTLTNLVNLSSSLNTCNSLFEGTRAGIKMLIRIIRKFFPILHVSQHSFLQHVLNEKIEELSEKASALLMTRYKELAYFEFDDVQGKSLVGRILTEQKVVEVDISPSEDFVVFWYGKKEIELFSLSDFKSRWKIDVIVVHRAIWLPHLDYNFMPLRHIAFHPKLNIIFPGQLDPVINLEGKYESGPITLENVPAKFTCCCFSHDRSKMVTKHDDELIVWNLLDNEKVVTLPCSSPLYSICFSGNDRYIATTDRSFVNVYDTENSYSLTRECSSDTDLIVFSTFKLDSWYLRSSNPFKGTIVKYDLRKQPFYMDFMFLPRNERAACEFQAMMENRTPMWFQKLGSSGNFLILVNGNILSIKRYDYELRISKVSELSKGSKLKQDYDEWLTGVSFPWTKSSAISVNGRYIYTSGPCISLNNTVLSSIEPGKSWTLIRIKCSTLLPVTNGVFALKVEKEFDEGTPELWNADLTKSLFKFPELTGTRHCLSVTENLVACIMTSEVCFFDVAKKEIVARTQLTEQNSRLDELITCSSQYHVVYGRKLHRDTLLLQKTKVASLSEVLLKILKSTIYLIVQACFSPSGGLLAFCFRGTFLIPILDISTFQIVCVLQNMEANKVEFFDEEHLLCNNVFDDFLFLVNVKNGDILARISVGGNGKWNFSVCRKTGDIVVFDRQCKTLRLLKLWLPHQRKDKNELRESSLLTHA